MTTGVETQDIEEIPEFETQDISDILEGIKSLGKAKKEAAQYLKRAEAAEKKLEALLNPESDNQWQDTFEKLIEYKDTTQEYKVAKGMSTLTGRPDLDVLLQNKDGLVRYFIEKFNGAIKHIEVAERIPGKMQSDKYSFLTPADKLNILKLGQIAMGRRNPETENEADRERRKNPRTRNKKINKQIIK